MSVRLRWNPGILCVESRNRKDQSADMRECDKKKRLPGAAEKRV